MRDLAWTGCAIWRGISARFEMERVRDLLWNTHFKDRDKDGLGILLESLMGIEVSGDRRNRDRKIRILEQALLDVKLHRQHGLWNDSSEMIGDFLDRVYSTSE